MKLMYVALGALLDWVMRTEEGKDFANDILRSGMSKAKKMGRIRKHGSHKSKYDDYDDYEDDDYYDEDEDWDDYEKRRGVRKHGMAGERIDRERDRNRDRMNRDEDRESDRGYDRDYDRYEKRGSTSAVGFTPGNAYNNPSMNSNNSMSGSGGGNSSARY